ncbi:FAD dependent oxidoreductase [Radiomyces spectabilis]|uniref:FAD dependent oxidoreductase n=1 Tax=Radiomyces spectabilis TaxID=64574 RepID=UPI002220D4B2|nr:FAD dependent oxidoreductase [Radiomyces spectabilis]KAI8393452.1 FAD dependent oxidoreductase [Radiomyces spectabilis]
MSYQPPLPGSKIIIVGGGCFGLSTAYALSLKNKYDVWVYDRQPIPVPDAASTDINKIVRMDYADETLYMHMAIEAMPLWRQWNQERADMGLSPVFHQTGVLLLSSNGEYSKFERSSMQHIREAGYGHVIEEFPNGEAILKRYPQFKTAVQNGYNIGYLNKEGGWCNSSEAVKHMYFKCQQNGVNFVVGPDKGCLEKLIMASDGRGQIRGIQTKDGRTHDAALVILATGSWTPGLVDLSQQVVATGQTVIHFDMPPEYRQTPIDSPVWCADLSRTGFYGFPFNSDGKLKVGRHFSGYLWPREGDQISVPRTQITHAGDTIPIGALRDLRTFLETFFPHTSKLNVSHARLCWYCDSIDGHFLIAPHPDYQNLIIASGDSGHGMKFIPNIGFKICHVIEGIQSDYTRAWAWRNLSAKDTRLDGLRADVRSRPLILAEPDNEDARLATPEELLVLKAHL